MEKTINNENTTISWYRIQVTDQQMESSSIRINLTPSSYSVEHDPVKDGDDFLGQVVLNLSSLMKKNAGERGLPA